MAENKDKRTIEIIVNGQQANASLKEMNAAAAVLYNQFNKLSADDPGRAKLIADYQAVKDRIAGVKTELTGVSQTTSLLKQGFANAFAMFTGGGIIAAVQQVWGFLSSAKDEFQASAKTSADLEATLKATAHAAGLTAKEIGDIGEARAKVTLFDDDETNRASAMLLTFKNIKKGVFEDAIPAIQDIATKMAGDGPADLKGASIQVGKALNDPVKGITALTRVGVTFTEQQKDQIKQMVKVGDTAGAQKLILAELNSEFGGAAEAARKAGGGMATLSMRWGEMKETVGSFVSAGLSKLSDWFGRVLNQLEPVWEMFSALGAEVANLWHEVADLVAGLGLFGEKGDSAAFVANLLTGAITLLLTPIRLAVAVSRSMVDAFIDWYNKSEMLRGVLGGLGALIVSVFTTIKDDALKILGGVGDILIGIFTLDKDKIMAGFKSALAATADAALFSGERAAEAFMKGYQGSKNNRIVRTVRVETKETTSIEGGTAATNGEPASESEKDRKAREAAEKKAKAARDKIYKEQLADLKKWVDEEGDVLTLRNVFTQIRDAAANTDELKRREQQRKKIMQDADKKISELTGKEVDYTARVRAIVEERDLQLRELQSAFDEKDEKARQEALDKKIAAIEGSESEEEARLELRRELGLISEQEYQDQLYEIKVSALRDELKLLEDSGRGETEQAKKIRAALSKADTDHHKAKVELAAKDRKLQELGLKTATDVVTTGIQLLFADEEARRKHHGLYIAMSAAKIMMDGYQEVAAIWKYSADNPANGPTMGTAGIIMGGIQTAMAVARTFFTLSQLDAVPGYAAGGRTGNGVLVSPNTGMAVSPWGALLEYSGMRVGSNGKLTDNSGFAVAGVVHEDEYVIPKWLRQDPQVAAFENWVEAKRMRGFYEGGRTSDAGMTSPAPLASFGSDGAGTTEVLTAMLTELRSMSSGLAEVRNWQSKFQVVLDVQGHQKTVAEQKQVAYDSALRLSKN